MDIDDQFEKKLFFKKHYDSSSEEDKCEINELKDINNYYEIIMKKCNFL